MREAYVPEFVDEAVVRRQAEERDEVTFIHLHAYWQPCESHHGCYPVSGRSDVRSNRT